MGQPIRYTPAVEQPEPDEAETAAELNAQFKTILDTTSKNYGRAVRSVHAKGHGIARGLLTVAAGLPPELAQGLFARPGEHEATLRFSTNAGDILDDSISLPRGAALKILGMEGERLSGSEGDTTQRPDGKHYEAPSRDTRPQVGGGHHRRDYRGDWGYPPSQVGQDVILSEVLRCHLEPSFHKGDVDQVNVWRPLACPWRCRGLGGSFADLGAKFVDEPPLEAKRAMITLEHREPMLLGRVGPRD